MVVTVTDKYKIIYGISELKKQNIKQMKTRRNQNRIHI